MQTITEIALQRAERGVFDRRQAAYWVDNNNTRLDALLKRAVASNEIHRIRRGLYCLDNQYTKQQLHPFELAQRIHGPSYISLESALSFHGWIPENVPSITSTSLERSRSFNNIFGEFVFTRVPQVSFFKGVNRISIETHANFFIAVPLKALADYVYVYRLDWHSATPLLDSLRIDEDVLLKLTSTLFEQLIPLYNSSRVYRFLVGLRKDLTL